MCWDESGCRPKQNRATVKSVVRAPPVAFAPYVRVRTQIRTNPYDARTELRTQLRSQIRVKPLRNPYATYGAPPSAAASEEGKFFTGLEPPLPPNS